MKQAATMPLINQQPRVEGQTSKPGKAPRYPSLTFGSRSNTRACADATRRAGFDACDPALVECEHIARLRTPERIQRRPRSVDARRPVLCSRPTMAAFVFSSDNRQTRCLM